MPRYKVLSVGKIMGKVSTVSLGGCTPAVNVNSKLDSLIELASESESALAVVDDAGQLVGELNQSMILKAMNSKS